jgi:hypothetical protein
MRIKIIYDGGISMIDNKFFQTILNYVENFLGEMKDKDICKITMGNDKLQKLTPNGIEEQEGTNYLCLVAKKVKEVPEGFLVMNLDNPAKKLFEECYPEVMKQPDCLESSELLEEMAELAHSQWSGWMKYLFSKSTINADGTCTIPKWAVDRWECQMNTDYDDLSEPEKDSDRNEARKFIDAFKDIKV